MSRIVSLLMVFILSTPARGGEIQFIREDWHKARELAREQNKMLLVDFYTDWCGWCKEMDKKTFPDAIVSEFINENFVALSIDAEKGLGIEVAMKYRVNGFPTYGYFTPDGKLITKSIGYAPPEDYIETLRNVADLHSKGFYLKGVSGELDPGFPEFYLAAGGAKGERTMPSDSVVNDWLSKQPDLFNEVSFSVLFRFPTSDKYADYFLENRETYAGLYGKDDVEMKTSDIIYGKLRAAIRERDEKLLDQVIALSEKYEEGDREKKRNSYTMSYYKGVKDWKKYAGMVDESIRARTMSDAGVNSAAWTLYEGCDDMNIIHMATAWMKKTVESSPEYAYLDTYAALLYKGGDLTLAEEWALKAIEKGKADGSAVKETEELLNTIRGVAQ